VNKHKSLFQVQKVSVQSFSVSEVNSRRIRCRKDSRWEDPLQSNQHQTNTVQWYLSFSFRSSISKRVSGRLQGLRKHESRSRFWEHQNMDKEVSIFRWVYVTLLVLDESACSLETG